MTTDPSLKRITLDPASIKEMQKILESIKYPQDQCPHPIDGVNIIDYNKGTDWLCDVCGKGDTK